MLRHLPGKIRRSESLWKKIADVVALNFATSLSADDLEVAELGNELTAEAAWVDEVVFHVGCDKDGNKVLLALANSRADSRALSA